jgi:DNA-binding transcriptional LysR family regulator
MNQIDLINNKHEANGMRMRKTNWKEIDLNLLVAFQALYRTNSVTIAAEQCFVSQSAMSHTLQRIRKMFNDPLFNRVGSNMEPTKKAHEISPIVDELLYSIENKLLAKSDFSARAFNGVWKIGLTDYAEQLFAPSLFDTIRAQSPQSQISFYNVNRSNYRETANSEQIDVVIGSINGLDSRFNQEHLYTEDHLCLFDPKTVSFRNEISLEEFTSIEHALVSPDGNLSTHIDKELARLSHSRRVSVASSNFLTVRRLLLERELICIVPRRFAEMQMYNYALMALLPPISVPSFDIRLIYPKANEHENKNHWLRSTIKETILCN